MEEFEKFKVRDKQLVRMLQQPTEDDADKILKELHEYILVTQSAAEELDLRWDAPLDCAKAFYLYGKPKFFGVHFDPPVLLRTFHWTPAKLQYFGEMFNKSFELWDEFKRSYIESRIMFPSPVPTEEVPCD